jgi:hypothetical protein
VDQSPEKKRIKRRSALGGAIGVALRALRSTSPVAAFEERGCAT